MRNSLITAVLLLTFSSLAQAGCLQELGQRASAEVAADRQRYENGEISKVVFNAFVLAAADGVRVSGQFDCEDGVTRAQVEELAQDVLKKRLP